MKATAVDDASNAPAIGDTHEGGTFKSYFHPANEGICCKHQRRTIDTSKDQLHDAIVAPRNI